MLSVRLFGRLSVHDGDTELERLATGKPTELFCYLLLHRERLHSREALASLFWGDHTTSQSKKHLRQALWRIQALLERESQPLSIFVADRDSLRVNCNDDIWLDVAIFEKASLQLRDMPGQKMSAAHAEMLNTAVQLYRGELLEGWYQDWCLFDRERLRNVYLLMLNKLMLYHEDRKQAEAGLECGERILRLDRAHERTYQTMMRLHHLIDDRAGAVRVFQRCAAALKEELGITPSRHTVQTLEQIRGDRVPDVWGAQANGLMQDASKAEPFTFHQVISQLKQALSLLNDAQTHILNEPQPAKRISAPRATKSKGTPLIKGPQRSS
jgi:DNA-binding SARP family transcriptional activator